MRFTEYFKHAAEPIISFEVFPPKTDAAMDNLRRILPELIALAPAYITVTYGALGSTRERTLEIAGLVKNEFGHEAACHLTCVGSSRSELDRILHDIYQAGIENIVALRGDPPKGTTSFSPPPDGYAHANELVSHIRTFENKSLYNARFGIAVAGYPEKHLEAPDTMSDLTNLKRKVDAGADVVITQLFYDNADYFRFVKQARAIGITVPVVPGLLPILSVKQIRRITAMCGSSIPPALQSQLECASDDDRAAEAIGIRQCIDQARELIEHGAPGIHFYVLNQSNHMQQILSELRPVIRQRNTQLRDWAGPDGTSR
jgi:methylenetetrahydrofolate reductase (NADPH)